MYIAKRVLSVEIRTLQVIGFRIDVVNWKPHFHSISITNIKQFNDKNLSYLFQCMLQTWYLSTDMQMFVIAPIVLIPLAIVLRNPKRLMPSMIAMLVLNLLFTAIPIWAKLHWRKYTK